MVKGEAQLEQQLTLENARGDSRVTDGTEQDCVMFGEGCQVGIREGFARGQVTTSTKVEIGGLEVDARTGGHLVDRLEGNSGYLRANAVSADDGDLVFTGHECSKGLCFRQV